MTMSDSDLGIVEFKVRGDLTDFRKAREQLDQLRDEAAQVIDFGISGDFGFGFESRDSWPQNISNQMDSSMDSFMSGFNSSCNPFDANTTFDPEDLGGAESMLIKWEEADNAAGIRRRELEPALDLPRPTRAHKKAHKAHEAAIERHDASELAHLRNSENFVTMPAAEGESYALAADHHPAQQHTQTTATNTKEIVDLLREIAGKLPQGQIISLFAGT
jgi:hypothetical protein